MDENLLSQARAVMRMLRGVMRKLFTSDSDMAEELPLAQLRVCAILSDGPRSMSAVGRELGVSLSAMTQLADRLERARMVQRVSEGNDRRVRQLQLTEEGEKVMRRRRDAHIGQALAALEQLSPDARAEVLAGLETLANACVALEGQDAVGAIV
jgi:DNA-binding MarR family transcriptional regulator